MNKLLISLFMLVAINGRSQDKRLKDSFDNVIIDRVIKPAAIATPLGEEPDWLSIKKQVSDKYSVTEADRTITKAQIYYYYSKDWTKFSTAIVHYTEVYESKDDFKLMYTNAIYILEHSDNPKELKTAQAWIKRAYDKEPTNSAYKQTYDALAMKIQNLL